MKTQSSLFGGLFAFIVMVIALFLNVGSISRADPLLVADSGVLGFPTSGPIVINFTIDLYGQNGEEITSVQLTDPWTGAPQNLDYSYNTGTHYHADGWVVYRLWEGEGMPIQITINTRTLHTYSGGYYYTYRSYYWQWFAAM
jgi:hypothetical protein